MVDVPVSCYCSFRGGMFPCQPTNQTHSTTTYHEFTWPPLLHYPHLLQVHIGNLNKSWQLPCRERGDIPPGEKEHHLKKAFKKGYVISQEDKNQLWPTLFEIREIRGFLASTHAWSFLFPSIHFIHQWWIFNYTWWIVNYQYGGLLITSWWIVKYPYDGSLFMNHVLQFYNSGMFFLLHCQFIKGSCSKVTNNKRLM